MLTIVEQKFIQLIVTDLSTFNGTQFEYFCKEILKLILADKGDRLEVLHKGHNLYAKPVGYTADFITDDAEIIGQCGTDGDYFTDFEKPLKDINRVFANHKKCSKIYLFSNQRATGGNFTDLKHAIDAQYSSIDVDPYDAEKIANVILDNITLSNIILPLMPDLPASYEYYKILPQINKLPSITANYYGRQEDETKITNLLQVQSVIQCYGLSGIGKTYLSIAVAQSLTKKYDSVIWLNGDDFIGRINFAAVKIARLNNFINLEILLENHKVLVVIDNLNHDILSFTEDFEKHNKKSSACIITSIQRDLPEKKAYQLSYLPFEQARQILEEGAFIPSVDQSEKIVKFVNGYPLVLRLVKAAVETEELTWNDVINELNNITGMTDESNNQLSQRIIGRFKNTLSKELGLLKFLDNRIISKHFLRDQLGQISITKLTKRAILTDYDSDFFVMHQLILDSIKSEINLNNDLYENSLEEYLKKFNPQKSLSYYLFLFNHEKMIDEIYSRQLDDAALKRLILYALIQKSDLNSNTKRIEGELTDLSFDSQNPLDVYLIIERYELELSKINFNKEQAKYNAKADEIVSELIEIKKQYPDGDISTLIEHHIGKILAKQQKYDEAVIRFKNVIAADPKADYAMLQLCRLYERQNKIDEALQQWEAAFLIGEQTEERSLSITLSLYESLVKDGFENLRQKYLDDKIDDFLQFFVRSVNASFEHPYRVLKSLCKHLSYNQAECYQEICQNLPLPANTSENEELRKAFAAIQLAYYNLLKYSDRGDKEETMNEVFELSEQYWKTVDLTDTHNLKGIIDLHIAIDKYDTALRYVQLQSESPFKDQVLTKIFRGLKDFDQALTHINKALANSDNLKEFFRAAFMNDKAELLHDMGDPTCIDVLIQAIAKQNTLKTIDAWKAKADRWRSEFSPNR